MAKSPSAFRTISEVSGDLEVPAHVLRFWETKFTQVKPLKRGGGRRYYRPEDVETLRRIRHLLYEEKYTIKGVQKLFKENGVFPRDAGGGAAAKAAASNAAMPDTAMAVAGQGELPMTELALDDDPQDIRFKPRMDDALVTGNPGALQKSPPPAHMRTGQDVLSANVRQLFSEIRGELLQVREILSEAALSD